MQTAANTPQVASTLCSALSVHHDCCAHGPDMFRCRGEPLEDVTPKAVLEALSDAGWEIVPSRLADTLRSIAAGRCQDPGVRGSYGPRCVGGSCVTCQARAALAGYDETIVPR